MRATKLASEVRWNRVLGELAVIIGGVLIALALDSWWGERQERKDERGYMRQLLSDLRETDRRLNESIAGDTRTLVWVTSVVERAFTGPLPPRDSLDLPTGYNQFRPLTGTQVALVQGGALSLVRNDSIRFEVVAYAALVNATETILRHTETLIWNSTERVFLGRARHSRPSTVPGSRTGAWGPVDPVAVLNDPDVISALQVQAAASQNRIRNLERLKAPTANLIRLLEKELDRE